MTLTSQLACVTPHDLSSGLMACKSVVRDKPFVTSYLCKSTHGKPTYLLHKKKVKTLLWSTYETGLPSYQLKISPIIYNERRFRLSSSIRFLSVQ